MDNTSFITLEPGQRHVLTDMYRDHRYQRFFIDTVVEDYVGDMAHGGLGEFLTDDPSDPHVGQITLEADTILSGDAAYPAARDLVVHLQQSACKPWEELNGSMLTCEAPGWRELVLDVYGDHVRFVPRVEYDWTPLDIEYLRGLSRQLPSGYHIRHHDLSLAEQENAESLNHPRAYKSFVQARKFFEKGIWYEVMHGDEVAGEISSYTICRRGVEIGIEVFPVHRRQGLATALAAVFIVHCLERDIIPHWSTRNNPTSDHLAEKLGYVRAYEYEVLSIPKIEDRR